LRDLRAPADPHSSPNEKKNFLVLQNPSSNPSKMRETSLPPIPEIFGASSNYRKFLPASDELAPGSLQSRRRRRGCSSSRRGWWRCSSLCRCRRGCSSTRRGWWRCCLRRWRVEVL
jgi:hypothetical protein